MTIQKPDPDKRSMLNIQIRVACVVSIALAIAKLDGTPIGWWTVASPLLAVAAFLIAVAAVVLPGVIVAVVHQAKSKS